MSLKSYIISFTVAIVLAVIAIFTKISSPFGPIFWVACYALWTGLAGIIFCLSKYWLGKKNWLFRLAGMGTLLIGIMIVLIVVSASWDYRMLLPITTSQSLSASAYNEDLDQFEEIIKTHPGFNSNIDSICQEELNKLWNEFKSVDRDQLIYRLTALVGLYRDGHSFVPPFQVYNRSRYFPVLGHFFTEGLYIIKSADKYKHLRGKKLIAINGIAIDTIMANITEWSGPENEWNARSRFNFYLFSTHTLRSLKVISSDKARLTIQGTNDREEHIPVSSAPFLNYLFWTFKPGTDPKPVLPFVRKPNYRIIIEEEKITLEINLIENISAENTIKMLSQELADHLNKGQITRLIVDLRNNSGGNNALYQPIINVITEYPSINNPKNLFVFTSRNTFSAGINFVDDLQFYTNAVLVGEPPGAAATHYGDASFHTLNHSGIFFFLSTRQWTAKDSTNTSPMIHLDMEVDYHYSQYEKGRDPWEEIIE